MGVKFTSDTGGYITGIRFYKAAANTGTHVGNLWSSSGTLLATATFTGETASGWQQVNFSTPVLITANTTYVASYHTATGHTSDDPTYFTSIGVDNAPLHALASGVSGGNGVYANGSSSVFPSNTNLASNYWVDVAFQVTATVPGLVGYWTFDDGTGTTAADSSGNGHTASLVNGTTWTTGKIAGAVSANGTNQYVSVPAIDLSTTKAVTVAAWVNRTYSTAGGHVLAEASANFNSSTTGFGLFPDDSTCNGIMAGVHGDVGYSINCYAQPSSGVWHHLVVIYDKSQPGNNEVALYIDGVLKTPTQNYLTANNTNNFGNNLIYLFSRGGTQEFNAGQMDDLRLYNRALSALEIQQLYNLGAGGPVLVSLAVTPANPSIVKGTTQQFTATGTFSDASTQNLTSSVTWTSTSTAVATINSAGLATSVAAGSTTIQASSGSVSGSTGLTVTPPVLVSIAVTPASPFVAVGSAQQFTATGTYSDSSTQNITSSVTWSSSNTATATINASGLASALAKGTTTIQATSGSISGSTTLTVTAALVSIAVTPANPTIAKGTAQQFTATGTYSDSTTQNITNAVTWSSSSTVVATVNTTGLASTLGLGSTTIQATSGSISGSTSLTVTAPVLISIVVTPANGSIVKGATQQFTATGIYSDSSTQNLTSSVTWSSTSTATATITSTGLATGVAAGSTTIQATSGSVNGSTGLTVTATPPGLVGYWTFDDGTGTTAADSSGNGHTASLVNGTTWTTGKIGGAVSANGTNQYVSVPAIDLSATSAVTVAAWVNRTYSTAGGHVLVEASANFNGSTTGFGFFPDDSTCNGIMAGVHGDVGYTINCYNQPSSGVWHHIAAIYDKSKTGSNEVALYIDGVLQTPKQNYLTANNTNNFGNNPTYLFSRGGTQEYAAGAVDNLQLYNRALSAAEIQQIYNSTSGAALVSLAVTPANPSIVRGTTQQFTATGTFSDASTQNLTSSVTWTSTSTAVATINSAGLATSVAAGSTTIQASSGSVSGSTGLTVTPPVLVSIAVTPASPFVATGSAQQFTATGTYSDSSTQNMTSSVTWSSSNTATATINASGLASALAKGTTTIQATSGSISGSTTLTVTAALVSIAVTPANPTIAKGTAQQFTATGTYSDSTTQNITNAVTWSSSSTVVATVNTTGLASTLGLGSTTIQATSGSVSGSTSLTVTAPVLISIVVTPANGSIVKGATQQFTATGTYSDSSAQNLTSSVTWSSTSTATATITSTGLATGVAAGNTTIQATSGSVSGSTGLTVTATLPGLVGYWTFDDGTGTTAVDSSGNGHTASLVNGTTWTTGKIAGAIAANGVNQYANIPAIDLSTTKAVTVAAWVNRTYSTAGGQVLVEASANFNSSTTGFGLFPDDSTCNGIMAGVRGDTGYSINCYAQPSSGIWHHLVVIYDKSQPGNNEVALYIDGVLKTPTQNYLTANNTNNFGSNPIFLFSRGGAQEFAAGQMDDLQIYNRALSASEIQQIYNPGGPPAPLTITLSPTNVAGGGTSEGTVTLGSAAPSGGAVVTLSSSNTLVATVPASVTVTPGSTTAIFTVTTSTVGAPTTVTIIGTYGVTQTANLTVTPAVGSTGQFVQWASGDSAAASSSTSYQDGPATTGDLILVFSHWDNQARTASVIDSLGNTYISIGGPVNVGATDRFQAWYAKNIHGGAPLGVTVTYSGQTTSFSLVDVIEYSGLDKIAPLDVFASATGSGTFQDSGPALTTTASNETIVGLFGYSSSSSPYTAGVGFTFHQYDATSMLEDLPVTATGSYNATATSAVSTGWAAFVIGFKNALQAPVMPQLASDNFNRANASTLGPNWTPLVGASTNAALQVINNQIASTAVSPAVAKEMYYGGLNWAPDQYSEVQIVDAIGNGYEGPAVRMTSNDTHYACVVYNQGSGNATVSIILDNAGVYSTLATSTTSTVTPGDIVRCSVKGTSLTMTDQTKLTTLLTATDGTIPSGYPGLVDSAGTVAVTNYVMANWAAGASAASLSTQQLANDDFNRANALSLGPNWHVGTGHGPIQIVNQQVQPYPAGGTPPSKEHYVAAGAFPNDQWSQMQVVFEDTLGDVGVEIRASDTSDTLYVTDVNLTGGPGAAETRIARVLNGTITALVVDQQWSAVTPGDYIRGQVQGNLISLIDVTTGTLLLTAFDTNINSGYAGISLQAVTGNPSDHIAAHWSGGTFH